MKDTMLQTLWALLDILVVSTGAGAPGLRQLESTFGVPLTPVSSNNYVAFYKNTRPITLADGITIDQVDLRQFNEEGKPPIIVLKLAGACITAQDIEQHLGPLSSPVPPAHPVPNAQMERQAQIKGRRVVLGFQYDRPACLSSVGIHT